MPNPGYNWRFLLAWLLVAVAILNHYDLPFGDAVGDRVLLGCLVLLPFLVFRENGR